MNVPIFPVRYAVADKNSNTPAVSGNFTSPNNVAAPEGRIHYTLRRPRQGYIYVFSEKDSLWNTFAVNDYGVLSSADEKAPPRPPTTVVVVSENMAVEVPDDAPQEAPKHGRITCTSNGLLFVPQNAPVWLCFTNSKLHPETLKKAASDYAFRDRFMRRLDPSSWNGQRHTAALKDVKDHVADLRDLDGAAGSAVTSTNSARRGTRKKPADASGSPKNGKVRSDAFWFSQHPFAQQTVEQLKQATCKDAQEHGVVLALDDPAGITMDLGTFMNARMVIYDDQKQKDRKFVIGSAIGALKGSIIQQGEDSKALWTEVQAIGADASITNAGGAMIFTGEQQPLGDGIRKDPNLGAAIKKAGVEEWQKNSGATKNGVFRSHLKETELNDYLEKESNNRADHIQKKILYVAKMHGAWMQSAKLRIVFECHFYSEDLDSRYGELMHKCIDATQGWQPCGDLYKKWLDEANTMSPSNLLARALANNHPGVLREAKKLADKLSSLEPGQKVQVSGVQEPIPAPLSLPLDSLITAYRQMNVFSKSRLGLLLHEVSGPMAEVAREMLDNSVGKVAVCMMAGQAGKKLVVFSVVGTEQEFLESTGKLLGHLQGDTSKAKAQKNVKTLRKVTGATKKQGPIATRIKDQKLKDWRKPVKPNPVKGGPKVWKWMGVVDHEGDVAKIQSFKDLADSPHGNWKALTKGSKALQTEGAFILAGGILQIACLTKAYSDLRGSMAHEGRWDLGSRLFAGFVGLGATVADGFSCVLTAQAEAALPTGAFAQFEQAAAYARRLKTLGRWLGFAAAVVNGVLDGLKGFRAQLQGDLKMMGLYYASAATGIGMAAVFAFAPAAAHPIGWILLGLFLYVGYLINEETASRIREWTRRCCWAVGKDEDKDAPDKYADLATELKQLDLALGIDDGEPYLNQWQMAIM